MARRRTAWNPNCPPLNWKKRVAHFFGPLCFGPQSPPTVRSSPLKVQSPLNAWADCGRTAGGLFGRTTLLGDSLIFGDYLETSIHRSFHHKRFMMFIKASIEHQTDPQSALVIHGTHQKDICIKKPPSDISITYLPPPRPPPLPPGGPLPPPLSAQ